jgi:hypothetical protein
MLHIIRDLSDSLLNLIKDDPVRPEIPLEQRVNANSRIFVLKDAENRPIAVTCVKFLERVPSSVEELTDAAVNTNTAVFYTIWSYHPGAGQKLIREGLKELQKTMPNVKRFVTLSPTTDMARKFHLKNGANIFRVNHESVNYEYIQL